MRNWIWIIELREERTDHKRSHYTDVTVMHVASTKELAEAWIKDYSDACSGNNWYWWIGGEIIDGEFIDDCPQRTYDPDGTPRCEWSER